MIRDTASGKEEAFTQLYRRYAPAAAGLATRILRDPSLAEVVLQDVFVSIWQKSHTYDETRGNVRSWLFSQVHHRSVDMVRSEEAARRHAVASLEPPADDLDGVLERDWIGTRRAQVALALRGLSASQREVIQLAYYDGLTQTAIGKRLGIPLGTVKSRTTAGMRRLRGALANA